LYYYTNITTTFILYYTNITVEEKQMKCKECGKKEATEYGLCEDCLSKPIGSFSQKESWGNSCFEGDFDE
jgi:hypothetical protein